MADWQVLCEPEGANDNDLNEGGMVIYAQPHGRGEAARQEISRVAFVRRNSANPEASFKAQLARELDTARETVRVLNEQLAGAGDGGLR